MGVISDFKAVRDVQKLKKGKTVKLSISQIVNLIINLPDASRNLSKEDFNRIFDLYKVMRKCKSKMAMDDQKYVQTTTGIIKQFDIIAPYEAYSGGPKYECYLLMREIFGQHHQEVRQLRRDLAVAEKALNTAVKSYKENSRVHAMTPTDEQLRQLVALGRFTASEAQECISTRNTLALCLKAMPDMIARQEKVVADLKERIQKLLDDA